MDSSSENIDDSCEDTPEYRKSGIKSLKTRIFWRSQRARDTKLSQSASDISTEQEHGSDKDLSSQGIMGSRALSHDSIFMEDNVLTDPEPPTQENVNSRIKALQLKLQQQKLHLGPPPLVLPIRRPEESRRRQSEDEISPYRTTVVKGSDVPGQESVTKTLSRPLSPVLLPAPTKSTPIFLSHPLPGLSTSRTCASEPALDFSFPPSASPCLDTSAARHRISVKPRKQRSITKKRVTPTESNLPSITPGYFNHSDSVKEEENHQNNIQDEANLKEKGDVDISAPKKHFPSIKVKESEEWTNSHSQTSHSQERALSGVSALASSQVLRSQLQRLMDATSSERLNSSVESESKNRREAGYEIQVSSYERRNTIKKTQITEELTDTGSRVTFELTSAHKQLQEEIKSINFPQRLRAGAGTVNFSITSAKNQDLERPRSRSFVDKVEQPESKPKTEAENKFRASLKEKVPLRDWQPKGSMFTVGRLTKEGSAPKSLDLSWERKDNQEKKEEKPFVSKIAAAGTGILIGQESGTRQDGVEVAVDKQEEGERPAFGIKLRSTSQSLRYRPVSGEQLDKLTKQDVGEQAVFMSKKTPANISPPTTATGIDFTATDPTPSDFSLPAKITLQRASCDIPTLARAKISDIRYTETISSVPQEPPPVLQTASTEVSWMSLAMEKTKSFQHLMTSKLSRDITGMQAQPPRQTEVQTGAQVQAVKLQQSSTVPTQAVIQSPTVTVRATTVQGSSPAQTFKPTLVSLQQKTASALLKSFPETQNPPQTSESQVQSGPTHTHCSSQTLDQNKSWTTQSFFHVSKQTVTSSPVTQESATPSTISSGQNTTQQLPWSIRGLQPTNQLKSTASVSIASVTAVPPSLVSALGREEKEVVIQEKGVSTPLAKRALWDRSGSERLTFLQRKAELSSVTATTEVDVKKAQTDAQSPDQPVTLVRTYSSIVSRPEWKQGVKLSDSTPVTVPDRSHEDKWIRKNVVCSSPPTQPSVLQSMSDNTQPSWMELAKRKSMAWSDKTMD